MSQVALLHAQAYIRSLPVDQLRALQDPATMELELARQGIDTRNLTADEMQLLQEEIATVGHGEAPRPIQQEQVGGASQADLQQRVQLALDTDQRISDCGIDALVSGPVVTLTGTVSNRAQKQMAEEIVRSLPGVATVVNDIQIE